MTGGEGRLGRPPRRLPDPAVWEEPAMRAALAVHDIGEVYRALQRLGFSQQHIAALTGQSQPQVSSILKGRQVISYRVLSRIADGLGIPRGYLGLSWCACLAGTEALPVDVVPADEERVG